VDGSASRRKFVFGIVSHGASRWPPQIVIRSSAAGTSVRTVFAHLWDTTEPAVAAALGTAYPEQPGPTWVASVAGDPCLYISIYRQGPIEYPNWATRFDAVGGHPAVSVAADISGRHNGWPQVNEFMGLLLGRFRGLAEDDDSERLWSLAELRGETQVGQRFGEYWRSWGIPAA
jgi:hypothetical protein